MSYLSLSPGTAYPRTGRAQLLHLRAGALPAASGVTLAVPHRWASVIDPPRGLVELAAAHPDGIDVDVRVAEARSGPRGHLAVQLMGPVRVVGQPTAHTMPVAEGLMAAADVSVRLAQLECPRLTALCVRSVSDWAAEASVLLPYAAASTGRPYDYPSGWPVRAQGLLGDLEHLQRLEPLSPQGYALARAAAVLAAQPVQAVPDGTLPAAPEDGHVAAVGRAMTVAARAPSTDSTSPLIRVLAGLVYEEAYADSPEAEAASRLRSCISSSARAWESVRARMIVLGPDDQPG